MGLRIIQKGATRRAEVTESERLECLGAVSEVWHPARDGGGLDYPARMVAKINRLKAQLPSEADVEAMAVRIRTSILDGSTTPETSHLKVDVATLLELL